MLAKHNSNRKKRKIVLNGLSCNLKLYQLNFVFLSLFSRSDTIPVALPNGGTLLRHLTKMLSPAKIQWQSPLKNKTVLLDLPKNYVTGELFWLPADWIENKNKMRQSEKQLTTGNFDKETIDCFCKLQPATCRHEKA